MAKKKPMFEGKQLPQTNSKKTSRSTHEKIKQKKTSQKEVQRPGALVWWIIIFFWWIAFFMLMLVYSAFIFGEFIV